jgi:predicted metal-dependent hydrolase
MNAGLELRDRFRIEVWKWADRLGVRPRRVRIQFMRSKWASCSSRHTLTFALDLLDKPAGFRRFVIVHELLHLRVPNHGRLFKAMLTVHVPGWQRFVEQRTRSGLVG